MFPTVTFFSILVLTNFSAVDASPLTRDNGEATLALTKKLQKTGISNLAELGRTRVKAIKQTGHLGERSASVTITNTGVFYTAQVGIGSPATQYTLLVDTGSSNTWIGANNSYTETSTSQSTGESVSVSYGSGSFFGSEWIDDVTLAPGLTITNQSIGVANSSYGFSSIDGALGLGPVDLTENTVSGVSTVPTVTHNLFSQGTISEEVLGIYCVPSSVSDSAGALTFGGYDSSVVTGTVQYAPLTTISPASLYWGIDQSISYGNSTIMSKTAGIIDTGTTLNLIPTDAFQKYQSMTGGIMDQTTGLLAITSAQYSELQPLAFQINGVGYTLSPNAQIWLRSLNTGIGGNSSAIYLTVADIGTLSGSGIDFVNGLAFHERFYTVYDTTNGQVGFAETRYTSAEVN